MQANYYASCHQYMQDLQHQLDRCGSRLFL